jgi:hypothetical protein
LLVFLRGQDRNDVQLQAVGGIGQVFLYLRDPRVLSGSGKRTGDDGDIALLADFGNQAIDKGLRDAVRCRLLDKPGSRIRFRIGVVPDYWDARL